MHRRTLLTASAAAPAVPPVTWAAETPAGGPVGMRDRGEKDMLVTPLAEESEQPERGAS